ncbi:MAG: TIGR04283 family arsenosugar biosynthesis glycosyltransferase [Caldimicrobium sp.]
MGERVSVIIPTYNEEKYLPKLLKSLAFLNPDEVIVVDGKSTDNTGQIAYSFGAKFISCERGRGLQLHRGALEAKGNFLLFLHADTYLNERIDLSIITKKGIKAGFFNLKFEENNLSLRILARLINFRAKTLFLPYGDQGLFIDRDLYFQIGGYRNLPFLEDFDLIRRLKKVYLPRCLEHTLIVSGRKFQSKIPGYPFWISIKNNFLIALFLLGVSPEFLKKLYK